MSSEEQNASGRTRNAPAAAALRGFAALAVAVPLLLPLVAARMLPGSGTAIVAATAGLVAISAIRPVAGLVAVVLALPCSLWLAQWARGSPGPGEVVDLIMLAFAGGAAIRLVGASRSWGHLAAPATVLVAAILTSTVVELRALQAITPRDSLIPAIWNFVVNEYWTDMRPFPVLRVTWRWCAWLAAAVWASRILAGEGARATRLMGVWLASGALGAAMAVHQMFAIAAGHPDGFWTAIAAAWTRDRLSVLQPDVNAAGSYLLLFLVPAVFVSIVGRASVFVRVSVPLLVVAFGLARSRAAIGALVLVLCVAGIAALWRRRGRDARLSRAVATAAVIVVIGGATLAGTYLATAASHAAVGDAMRVRIDLTRVGVEALSRSPMFGVGLSDYIRTTRRLMTPDMTLLATTAPNGENAHNNFLQIAVELGLPACMVFLWLVWAAVGPALAHTMRSGPQTWGLALGIVAFLLSALLGHPLLVPLVGATFFLAVGITEGMMSSRHAPPSWAEPAAWIATGVYAGSLLWRW